MAAGTVLAAGTAIGGIAQSISGAKQKRDAMRAARNFRRQKLSNVNEGRRISTLGADLQREEQARIAASSVEALRSGGVRSLGNVGRIVQGTNLANRQIGSDLDRQRVALDRDIAMDEARIQQMQEARDNKELGALQGQVNAANQTMNAGFGNILSGVGGLEASGVFSDGESEENQGIGSRGQFMQTGNFLNQRQNSPYSTLGDSNFNQYPFIY